MEKAEDIFKKVDFGQAKLVARGLPAVYQATAEDSSDERPVYRSVIFNLLDIFALGVLGFCALIAKLGDIAVAGSPWFQFLPYFEHFCLGIFCLFLAAYVNETTGRLRPVSGTNWLDAQVKELDGLPPVLSIGLLVSATAYIIWAANGSPRLISSDLVLPDFGPLAVLVLLPFVASILLDIISLPSRCAKAQRLNSLNLPASSARATDFVAWLAAAVPLTTIAVFTVRIYQLHSLDALLTGHPLLLINATGTMAVLFIVLRNLILQSTRQKEMLRPWDLVPQMPYEKNDEVLIAYNHFSSISRWFRQKFALNSPWKAAVIGALAFLAAVLDAPMLLGWIVSWTLGGIGKITEDTIDPTGLHTLAGHATATFNIQLILFYILVATLTALFSIIAFVVAPKRIAANRKGLRVTYSKLSGLADEVVDWTEIKLIKIFRPEGRTNAQEDLLIFERAQGGRAVQIKLAGITTQKDRAVLLAAIDNFAPDVARASTIEETLRRPLENNYTELWLQALAAPPRREKLKPLIAGARLNDDRYEVRAQIGAGGQGFAYLSSDKATGKDVVLKETVLPVYVDIKARKQALETFEKEAKLLTRLDHPQVVKLNHFFIEDHRAYLALEHIDGLNLRRFVNENGALEESFLRELAWQMCSILEYLHGLSPPLVHRDFTPDNLILRRDGTLKLIDFNVAQQLDLAQAIATTGNVVGKQAYLPPEQFRGHAEAKSDLYALGATLYFLAVGHDPVPISVSRPNQDGLELSAELNLLVESLTQMEPSGRPESASAVKRMLTP